MSWDRNVQRTDYPWPKSKEKISLDLISKGPKRPSSEITMNRNDPEPNFPGTEITGDRNMSAIKCPGSEKSKSKCQGTKLSHD